MLKDSAGADYSYNIIFANLLNAGYATMNDLTQLILLRKHYSELLKLFFAEVQKGKQLAELTDLKNDIEFMRIEIEKAEAELNSKKDT